MEHEEREEIPWSSLIPQADTGIDRRWYVVALVVGMIVLGFIGVRLWGRTVEPTPVAALPPTTDLVATPTTPTTQAPAELVVAESSLVASDSSDHHRSALVRAEWFIADFYTRDGGVDSAAAIEGAVVPELAESASRAYEAAAETESFVEWSRVAAFGERSDGSVAAVVAYRAITATPDGYERRPVVFVALDVRMVDGVPLVASLPVAVTAWSAADI